MEISILWHWPMLIQSWRKCHDPLAIHKQSIPCSVCRKQVLRMSTCLWEHLTWYLIAHWKVNDLQYPILCMKHWILLWNPVFDTNYQTMIRSFVKNLFSSLPMLKGIWDTKTSFPKTPNLEKLPGFNSWRFSNKRTHLLNFQPYWTEIWKKKHGNPLIQNRLINQVLHHLVGDLSHIPMSFSHFGTNGAVISRVPWCFAARKSLWLAD